MAAPGLVSMPIELLVHIIATYLSTKDLGALRLTSKFLENALFDSFAREFFAKKQFMLTTPSLNVLVEISKHPALSKVLKHVIIGLEQYHLPWNVFNDEDKRKAWDWGVADQVNLTSAGRDRDLLAEAFRNLPNLDTVGLRDYSASGRFRDNSNRWHSYGAPTVYEKTGVALQCFSDTGGVISHHYSTTVYTLLLRALAEANKTIPTIEVILRQSNSGLQDMAFFLSEPLTSGLQQVLQGLKTLLLTFTATYDVSRKRPMAHFANFISKVPQLTHLRLNFQKDQATPEEVLMWLADKSNSILPSLEILEVGMVMVTPEILFRAIDRFAPTLRTVSLWKVELVTTWSANHTTGDARPNTWRQFLVNTSKIPGLQLTSFTLGCIAQLHGGTRQNVQFIKPAAKAKRDANKDANKDDTGLAHQDFDRNRTVKGKMEEFLPCLIDDVTVRWPVVVPIVPILDDEEDEEDEEDIEHDDDNDEENEDEDNEE